MNRWIARFGLLAIFLSGTLAGFGLKPRDPCRCGDICTPRGATCGLKSCPSSEQKKTVGSQSPDLKDWYDQYNLKYFANKLPKNTIVKWGNPGLEPDGRKSYAVTIENDGYFEIIINPELNLGEQTAKMVLLHEMAHISTWAKDLSHGLVWQKEMHRLADEGAFEDLW